MNEKELSELKYKISMLGLSKKLTENNVISAIDDTISVSHETSKASNQRAYWMDDSKSILCSNCNYKVYLGTSDKDSHEGFRQIYKFCPNCGHRMGLI